MWLFIFFTNFDSTFAQVMVSHLQIRHQSIFKNSGVVSTSCIFTALCILLCQLLCFVLNPLGSKYSLISSSVILGDALYRHDSYHVAMCPAIVASTTQTFFSGCFHLHSKLSDSIFLLTVVLINKRNYHSSISSFIGTRFVDTGVV